MSRCTECGRRMADSDAKLSEVCMRCIVVAEHRGAKVRVRHYYRALEPNGETTVSVDGYDSAQDREIRDERDQIRPLKALDRTSGIY